MSCVQLENDRDELRGYLEIIGGRGTSVPEKLAIIARSLGWNYRRAKGHWYREARRIENQEMRVAREAAERTEEANLNATIQKLTTRIATLEAHLRALADEDRHRS